jgi:hypothetical protein
VSDRPPRAIGGANRMGKHRIHMRPRDTS